MCMRRFLVAAATAALVLAGCSGGGDQPAAPPPASPTPVPPTSTPADVGVAPTPTTSSPDDPMVIVFADGDPDIGPAPLTVQFSVDDPFMELLNPKFEWNFGDGSPISHQRSPKHVYEKPGKYTAHLRVTEFGDEDEDTVDIVVEEPEAAASGEAAGPRE